MHSAMATERSQLLLVNCTDSMFHVLRSVSAVLPHHLDCLRELASKGMHVSSAGWR